MEGANDSALGHIQSHEQNHSRQDGQKGTQQSKNQDNYTTNKQRQSEKKEVVVAGPPRSFVLYYTVFPGNGPQVIRDAMARRSNARVQWKEVSKDAVTYNTD